MSGSEVVSAGGKKMEQDALAAGVTRYFLCNDLYLPRELLRLFLFRGNYSMADTASHSGRLARSSPQL